MGDGVKGVWDGLRELGVETGCALVVHSSFKALGKVEGGAGAVFEALQEAVGAKGTLVVPAFSYATVGPENPRFDARTTPVCPGVGYLPEFFRTQVRGVVRSLHPTHSCCMKGPDAAWLAEGHETDATPVGPHSPLSKVPQLNGWILFLGCSPDRNTSMHGVEETAEPPYLLKRDQKIRYELTDVQGNVHEHWAIPHNFEMGGVHFEQKYSRVIDLLDEKDVRRGRVLNADCVLLRAKAVWEKGRAALEKDPYYFVDRTAVPPC